MRLAALETAKLTDGMDIRRFRLHPLKGNRKDYWSITVSVNREVTFPFTEGNVFIIDY
jgi:proteic killer suppression protein